MSRYFVYREHRLIAVVHGRSPDAAIRSACLKTRRDCNGTAYWAERIELRERSRPLVKPVTAPRPSGAS